MVYDLTGYGERCLDPILALGRKRQAEARRAHRRLECGRNLDLDSSGVRLFLHGVADAVQSARTCRLLPRDRPADCPPAHHLGVIVDDHQPSGERDARILQETKRAGRLEGQRLDDHPCRLERFGQRFECELWNARPVEQPESDAFVRIHHVIRKRAPARFEFPRAKVLGRVFDEVGLVGLRERDVLVERLVR